MTGPSKRIIKEESGELTIFDLDNNKVLEIIDTPINPRIVGNDTKIIISKKDRTSFYEIIDADTVIETQTKPAAPVPFAGTMRDLFDYLYDNGFFSNNSSIGSGDASASNQALEIAELQSIKTNQTNRTQKTQISDGVKEVSITETQPAFAAQQATAEIKIQVPSTSGSQIDLTDGSVYSIFGNTNWTISGDVNDDATNIASAITGNFTGWSAVSIGDTVFLTRTAAGSVFFTLLANSSPTDWAVVTITSFGSDYVPSVEGLDVNIVGDSVGFNKEETQNRVLSTLLGEVVTYAAGIVGLVADESGANDIFVLENTSQRVIKIQHLSIIGKLAAVIDTTNATIKILKRNSLNADGVFTEIDAVGFDSANPPASLVVRAYTENPTTEGNLVGVMHSSMIYIGTDTKPPTLINASTAWQLPKLNGIQQVISIRNDECLCVNLDGQAIAGNLFNIDCVWTEED